MAPSQQPRIPTVKKETRKAREFPPRLESATTVRSVPGATELQLVRQQRPKPKVRGLPELGQAASLGAPAMPRRRVVLAKLKPSSSSHGSGDRANARPE